MSRKIHFLIRKTNQNVQTSLPESSARETASIVRRIEQRNKRQRYCERVSPYLIGAIVNFVRCVL